MTLVTVIDIFLDAQFFQQQHTTDTQQNFLLQTILPVATIKTVGNRLVEIRVHLVVGVKQIKFHTAHVHTPDISMNLIVGIRHIYNHWITIVVKLTLDGQRTKVLSLVISNLLTIHREALCEIAETIQETDGTHIYI